MEIFIQLNFCPVQNGPKNHGLILSNPYFGINFAITANKGSVVVTMKADRELVENRYDEKQFKSLDDKAKKIVYIAHLCKAYNLFKTELQLVSGKNILDVKFLTEEIIQNEKETLGDNDLIIHRTSAASFLGKMGWSENELKHYGLLRTDKWQPELSQEKRMIKFENKKIESVADYLAHKKIITDQEKETLLETQHESMRELVINIFEAAEPMYNTSNYTQNTEGAIFTENALINIYRSLQKNLIPLIKKGIKTELTADEFIQIQEFYNLLKSAFEVYAKNNSDTLEFKTQLRRFDNIAENFNKLSQMQKGELITNPGEDELDGLNNPILKSGLMLSSESREENVHFHDNDIFTSATTKKYWNDLLNLKNEVFYQNSNPSQINDNKKLNENIKLHISLVSDDYENHKMAIRDILVSFIQNETINEFKMVNSEALDKELNKLKLAEEEFKQYKIDFAKDESLYLCCGAYENLTKVLDRAYRRRTRYLPRNNEEFNSVISVFKNQRESLERFKNSDQFTIYIPSDYSNENIASLCKKINNYFIEHVVSVNPLRSDVSLSLSDQINMRLEYFESGSDKNRIDAVKQPNELESRRKRAIEELKKNSLYNYLHQSCVLKISNKKQPRIAISNDKIDETIINLIDSEITRLKKSEIGDFFTFDSKNKIEAMENLKNRLTDANKNQTYSQIITEWENELKYKNGWGTLVSRSTMLSAHRYYFSDFFSIFSNKKTDTENFIAALKNNYGHMFIENNKDPIINEVLYGTYSR